MRIALADAAPLYRDAPEASEARAGGSGIIRAFMDEAIPGRDVATRQLAAVLIETTLTQVGSNFSETKRSADEIETFADAMADMFSAYLVGIEPTFAD